MRNAGLNGKLFSYGKGRINLLVALALFWAGLFGVLATAPAANATLGSINNTINFQGRLLNAAGAVVADGTYNIEFKIYQDGPGNVAGDTGGTLDWTEAYLDSNSQGVVVKNGYFSVNLGSLCSLSGGSCQGATNTAVAFNDSVLWLSMNVAGGSNATASCGATQALFTSACAPDGEMLPMKGLSSDVYAQVAAGLTSAGGVITAAGFIQNQTTGAQAASYWIQGTADIAPTTNSVNALQVTGTTGTAATAVTIAQGGAADGEDINVTNASGTAGSAIAITKTGAGSLNYGVSFTGTTATADIYRGSGNLTIQAAAGNIALTTTQANASTIVKTATNNSTAAFQIQNSSGNSLLNADTINMRLGVNVTYAALVSPSGLTVAAATSGSGNLSNSTVYYYKVTAIDSAGGETTPSSEQSTTPTHGIVNLYWTAVTGATGYKIYRSAGVAGAETYLTTVNSNYSSGNPYLDSGNGAVLPAAPTVPAPSGAGSLTSGVKFAYRIAAVDANGNVGPMGPETQDATATSSGQQKIAVSWAGVAGALSYNVYRTPAGTLGTEQFLINTQNLNYTDSGTVALTANVVPPGATTAYVSTNVASNNLQLSVGGSGTPTGQVYVSGTVPAGVLGVAGASAPNDVVVVGHYAYEIGNGFQIYDISNPASPILVGSNPNIGGSSLAIAGHYGYVHQNSTMEVVDISNPASPTEVTQVSTMGTDNFYGGSNEIYASGDYVYDVEYGGYFMVYNVSDPANPVMVSAVSMTADDDDGVFVAGRYAYISTWGGVGLYTFDISNPASVSSTPTASYVVGGVAEPTGVYVQGRYAYVTDDSGNGKLDIIDVSNPTASCAANCSIGVITTSNAAGSNPESVFVQGRYAYVTNIAGGTLGIYDVSNPAINCASSCGVGSINTGTGSQPDGLFVAGRYAYVADYGTNTLAIYDVGGEYAQQLQVGGTETGTLTVDTNAQVYGDEDIQGGLTVGANSALDGALGVSGPVDLQNNANSTTELQVSAASGANVLNVDTTNGKVDIGGLATPVISSWSMSTSGGSLAAGNTYYFKVTAVDAAGNQSAASQEYVCSANCGPTTGTTSEYTVNWGAIAGAASYDVYYGTAAGSETNYFNTASTTYTFTTTTGSTAGSPPGTDASYADVLAPSSSVFRTATNSSTGFQIQNQAGNQVFNVDTSGNTISLGKSTSVTGILSFLNSGAGSHAFTIQAASGGAAQQWTLPSAAPSVGSQCLQTTSGAAAVTLAWSGCTGSSTYTLSRTAGFPTDVHYNSGGTSTVSMSPVHAGDLMILNVLVESTSLSVSSIAPGTNTGAWTLQKSFTDSTNVWHLEVWTAVASSTATANATITWAGTDNVYTEYAVDSLTAGLGTSGTWSVSSAGALGNATSTNPPFPQLTATGNGQAYWGYFACGSAAITTCAGTALTGFTFTNPVSGTIVALDTSLVAGTNYQPTATQAPTAISETDALIIGASENGGSYINNNTVVQSGNFNIQAAATGSVAGTLQGNASGTADIFDLLNGSGNTVAKFGSAGTALFQTSTNSSTAFQIQNAATANNTIFNVDTTNGGRVTLTNNPNSITFVQEKDAHTATNTTDAQTVTLTSAPTVGDLVLVGVDIAGGSDTVTAVHENGVSLWKRVTNIAGSPAGTDKELWEGYVASTSGSTITVVFSGAPGALTDVAAEEFTTSGVSGSTYWNVIASNTASNGSGNATFPSVSSTLAGQMYWGYMQCTGTCTGGSSSGFSYTQTGASPANEVVYNPNLAASTPYAPVANQTSNTSAGVGAIIQVSVGNTLTVNGNSVLNGSTTINSDGIPLILNSTNSNDEDGIYFRSSTTNAEYADSAGAELGYVGSTGQIIQDSASGDFVMANGGGSIRLAAGNSTISTVVLSSGGINYIGDPDFAFGPGNGWEAGYVGGSCPLLDWSVVGTPTTCAQNLTAANTYEGASSLKLVTHAASGDGAQTSIFSSTPTTATSGTNYEVSFYVEQTSGTAITANNLEVLTSVSSGTAPTCTGSASTTLSSNGFVHVSCLLTGFNAVGSITNLKIEVLATAGYTFYIDGVQLQTGTSLSDFTPSNIQLRGVVTSPVAFQNTSNSTTAFQVQDASGTNTLFDIDTTGDNVNVGAVSSDNADTANIDSYTGGSATKTVNVGSTDGASALNLQSGTGNINLTTNTSSGGTILQPSVNSVNLFEVKNSSGTDVLRVDSTANTRVTIGNSATSSWVQHVDTNGTVGGNSQTEAFTPSAVGDVVVVAIKMSTTLYDVLGVSATGINFQQSPSEDIGSANHSIRVQVWYGTVTATGATTISILYTGNLPSVNCEISVDEFSSGLGANTLWSVTKAGSDDITPASTTLTFPSLQSTQAEELYYGYDETDGTGSAGGTSGFSYEVTGKKAVVAYATYTTASSSLSPTATTTSALSTGAAIVLNAYLNTNLDVRGSASIGGVTDTQTLLVKDALSAPTLTVNTATSGEQVIIGSGSTGEFIPKLLVLDNGNNSFDDSSIETDGAMYYNSSFKSFRCGQNGNWVACDGLTYSATASTAAVTYATVGSPVDMGHYTLPANDCQTGVTYMINAGGRITAHTATDLFRFYIYENGTTNTIVQTAGAGPEVTTASYWTLSAQVTCVSTTSVITNGTVIVTANTNGYLVGGVTLLNSGGTVSTWSASSTSFGIMGNWVGSNASSGDTLTTDSLTIQRLGP